MNTRNVIITILLLLLLAAALVRMGKLAGESGEALRQEALRIAMVHGELSAIRGRIFDVDGKPLAWSVRRYDLVLKEVDEARQSAIHDDLVKLFGANWGKVDALTPGVIKYDLTARELELADTLCQTYPALDVELAWERCYAENADLELLGKVRQEQGMEIGISGLEAEFEETLRGTPGRFSVMVDREGRWLDATYRMEREPEAGGDVMLEQEVEE